MKKKALGFMLAATMTVSVLAGCGGNQNEGNTNEKENVTNSNEDTQSVSAETNENGDETLTVWCWDPTFNIYAMEQAEKIYQKDHPDFKLDIQENIYNDIETKLITAATSGDYSTLPDIFLMQDYSFHKNIANFPGIFTELTDSGIDFSQFTEGKLADSTAEGKNYGLPFDNGATIMAIRSDMVEAAGLTVDDFKDTTWSQFEELAKKVVEANGVPMIASSGGSELLMEMLQSAGASPIVDGKVHIADNEALKKTMEVYKKLVDEGIIAEYTDWDQYIASMNDGKTAGVTYRTDKIKLVVTVINGKDGKLIRQVGVHAEKDGKDVKSSSFNDNKYSAGTLNVTKKVTGNSGDKNKKFHFTVTLTKPENKEVRSDITATVAGTSQTNPSLDWTKGSCTYGFDLADGETASLGNIPYGVTYTVAEDDYSTNGYTTTMSGNSGEVSKAEQTAAFTNDKNSDNIDTGINLTTLPYILVFAGVIVIAGAAFITRRRKYED